MEQQSSPPKRQYSIRNTEGREVAFYLAYDVHLRFKDKCCEPDLVEGTSAHLAACWNACEEHGIDDPEKTIKALVEALEIALDNMCSICCKPGDPHHKDAFPQLENQADKNEIAIAIETARAALGMTKGGG